jgi:hypothetical protein
MLGRVLFTFVWLIIAAGLVLPLYPGDEVISVVTAASNPVQPVAASEAFGCEDCPVADSADCRSDCPCDPLVPAVFVPLEDGTDMTLTGSARPPAKLPAKLPAI